MVAAWWGQGRRAWIPSADLPDDHPRLVDPVDRWARSEAPGWVVGGTTRAIVLWPAETSRRSERLAAGRVGWKLPFTLMMPTSAFPGHRSCLRSRPTPRALLCRFNTAPRRTSGSDRLRRSPCVGVDDGSPRRWRRPRRITQTPQMMYDGFRTRAVGRCRSTRPRRRSRNATCWPTRSRRLGPKETLIPAPSSRSRVKDIIDLIMGWVQ